MQMEEPVCAALGAAGIGLTGLIKGKTSRYIPVDLTYGENHLRLTALYDTGNNLVDPVTGEGVLILDAPAAQKLTGLTASQLRAPVEAMGALPGLRLIPYHTVGNSGFLLALRLSQAKIGDRQKCVIAAFSPQTFGNDYQALTGGNV